MKRIFAFILILTVFGCSEEKKKAKVPPFEFKKISVQEKMKIAVSEDYLMEQGYSKLAIKFLQDYYQHRGYEPKWINDSMLLDTSHFMKKIVTDNIAIGVPNARAIQADPKNFIQEELFLTAALGRIVYDLHHGMIDYENKVARPKDFITPDSLDILTTFSDTVDIRVQFMKFGRKDSLYSALAYGLLEWTDSLKVIDTARFNVPETKIDTVNSFIEARRSLISKGFMNDSIKDSIGITIALKRFQEANLLKPDGKIGKNTCRALNESIYDKMLRVILTMDKIRAKAAYPKKYLRINIPEYKLRFFEDDSLRSEHNIVVGKPPNTTPQLTSKLRTIVLYPYWNVPYSISTKEILPILKRNVGYLKKNHYKVYRGKTLIDPYSVSWRKYGIRTFPYKIVQDPGPWNALGIIKFDFHNEHSVYFHDTPAKALFGEPVRAFSHGCMRTQNPVELGKQILLKDSLSPRRFNAIRPDTLDSLLFKLPDSIPYTEKHLEVKLIDPIPIYIEYETASREGEKMRLHIDIYGRDEEYLKLLEE